MLSGKSDASEEFADMSPKASNSLIGDVNQPGLMQRVAYIPSNTKFSKSLFVAVQLHSVEIGAEVR